MEIRDNMDTHEGCVKARLLVSMSWWLIQHGTEAAHFQMQGVLRNDGIHHSIFPVQSWSQIKTIFSEQINEGEVSVC